MLALAAVQLAGAAERNAEAMQRGEAYMAAEGGIAGLRRRYGKDRTFAVPILTNVALADRVAWSEVTPLPFELATLPQSFYRFVRLPVVSYAIPALVAIGQAIHYHNPPGNRLIRRMRDLAIRPGLRVLQRMQPVSGGYLEAIPLTSFVVMSLASTGKLEHPVTLRGLDFLCETARADGSWPIDTNLATWGTTLAINALPEPFANGPTRTGDASSGETASHEAVVSRQPGVRCWRWLLNCQHRSRHPFTGASPGGWGWTNLSGAVPDADDTPGALIALKKFYDAAERLDRSVPADTKGQSVIASAAAGGAAESSVTPELLHATRRAATMGTRWLLDLQNRDGGWPTFCRGWGHLPFDRSGTDLTAHALRALLTWREVCPPRRWTRATRRGWRYLERTQCPDGSWLPTWFGNQSHPDQTNPVYGTARVLMAYRDWDRMGHPVATRGWRYLLKQQDASGGWSGGGTCDGELSECSVEETSVALEAILAVPEETRENSLADAINRGLNWLICAIENDEHRMPRPIGLYFAKLWYDESLYPLTFGLSALQAARNTMPGPGNKR